MRDGRGGSKRRRRLKRVDFEIYSLKPPVLLTPSAVFPRMVAAWGAGRQGFGGGERVQGVAVGIVWETSEKMRRNKMERIGHNE